MQNPEKIEDGVFYCGSHNERFKFNIICVNFIVELTEKNAAFNVVLASLLRKSCKKYPQDLDMGKRLKQLYGANLFCDVKKAGEKQIVVFGIEVLDDEFSFDKEALTKDAVELLMEILFNPKIENKSFCEKDVELEKKELENLIKAIYNDKKQFALLKAVQHLFKGQNAAVLKYGSLKEIEKINSKNLVECYNSLILKSNVLITSAGRRDNKKNLEPLFEKFKNLKREPVIFKNKNYFLVEKKEIKEQDSLTQAKLVVCFLKKEELAKEKSFEEYVSCLVLNAIFGATATSFLFTKVREEKNLCYYCSSFFNGFLNAIFVESGVNSFKAEEAFKEIVLQMDLIKKGEFKEKDLNQAKFFLESVFKNTLDSESKICGYFLTNFLNQHNKSLEQTLEQIKKITKQNVLNSAKQFEVALKYLLKERENKNERTNF